MRLVSHGELLGEMSGERSYTFVKIFLTNDNLLEQRIKFWHRGIYHFSGSKIISMYSSQSPYDLAIFCQRGQKSTFEAKISKICTKTENKIFQNS